MLSSASDRKTSRHRPSMSWVVEAASWGRFECGKTDPQMRLEHGPYEEPPFRYAIERTSYGWRFRESTTVC